MVGTLLPFGSLVSKNKPADYFYAARIFVDWLAQTNQSVWQMLPISPSSTISPYSTYGIGVDPKYGSYDDFVNLRDYANKKGVQLWGDLPFYIDKSSPLFSECRDCFSIETDYVSGCLKDVYFSDRQVWAMPLYNYNHLDSVFELWKKRIYFLSGIFTKVRLDAAVRFFTYEKLHINNPKLDIISEGPGEDFFIKIISFARENKLELFAEDISGLNMSPLRQVCRKLKVPTVQVFTMTAFRPDPKKIFYTSTHDTPSMAAYLASLNPDQLKKVHHVYGKNILENLKKTTGTLIVSFQDWFGGRDRINTPGEINKNNWKYQMSLPVEQLPITLLSA